MMELLRNIDFKVGLLIAFIASVSTYILTAIYNKYINRPRLDIDMYKKNSLRRNRDDMNKNKRVQMPSGEREVDRFTAEYHIETIYDYEITIYNNSETSAHYIKTFYRKDGPKFNSIDKLGVAPLPNGQSVALIGHVIEHSVMKLKDKSAKVGEHPMMIDGFELLIEYKNPKRASFYTLLKVKNGKGINVYKWIKPRGFVSY